MQSHKRLITALLAVGFVGASLLPAGVATALADIHSLDVRFNGASLACFDRDPSWSDDEFSIHYGEYFIMESNSLGSVEDARDYVQSAIESAFDGFYTAVFEDYARTHFDDFADRTEYYATYHAELVETYIDAKLISIAQSLFGEEYVKNYDILANYCSEEGAPIATTFDGDGFTGYFRMNGEEVTLDNEDLTFLGDGFGYHRDDFGDVRVSLERIDATTMKANYAITNLTGAAAEYGLAFYGDIEFGENDDAAISRTDDSFTIIQDRATPSRYYDFSETFGAKFRMQLDPMPSSIYVGNYSDARRNHWTTSSYTHFSAVDDLDTGLAYSWQGTMADGETKHFSVTYYIELEDGYYSNKFYYLSNEYAEPLDEIDAIDGLSLVLPDLADSTRKGYHYAWNTRADGTGISYGSHDTILADQDEQNFYEVEKANQLVNEVYTGWTKIHESSFVMTDAIRDKFSSLLGDVYSDITMGMEVYDDEDDLTDYFEDGSFDEEKLIAAAGGEKYIPSTMLYLYGPYADYVVDEEGTSVSADFDDLFPVTVRMKLDEFYADGKANFSIVRVKCGREHTEDDYACFDYETMPTTYDYKTRELLMDFDGLTWEYLDDGYYDYVFVLAYTDIPDVPNTGSVSSIVASTFIGLPAVIAAAYVTKRTAKR